jgi:hypothetical protein
VLQSQAFFTLLFAVMLLGELADQPSGFAGGRRWFAATGAGDDLRPDLC